MAGNQTKCYPIRTDVLMTVLSGYASIRKCQQILWLTNYMDKLTIYSMMGRYDITTIQIHTLVFLTLSQSEDEGLKPSGLIQL